MSAQSNNLLDLFLICNVPSTNNYHLFCRFLIHEDFTVGAYFEPQLADKYPAPHSYEMEEFYDKANTSFREIEGCALVTGFLFGTFSSYDESLVAAKAYSTKELLDKFFRIYKDATKYQ
jgi:hypothetical protein